jgi:hypothetical protein
MLKRFINVNIGRKLQVKMIITIGINTIYIMIRMINKANNKNQKQ